MFKIMSVEIKKIVSKPGIYILSLLLAIILVLGVFIYKPTVHEDTTFELNGTTYIEKYTDFNAGVNAGKKADTLTKLEGSIKAINNYRIEYNDETLTQSQYINQLVYNFKECYDDYKDCTNDKSPQEDVDSFREDLVNCLETLNSAIINALSQSQEGSFSIITSKSNYYKYKSTYKEVLSWAKQNKSKENLKEHFITFETKYSEDFFNTIQNFKYPSISNNFIKSYTTNEEGTKLFTLYKRLNTIEDEIEINRLVASQPEETKFNNKYAYLMDELANEYVNTINTYIGLIKYELITNSFSNLSTKEQLTTLYLNEFSHYDAKSLLIRYEYLFENNEFENDMARPLTIGVTSNNDINAYDYAYFVLKIFSFVIIIYSIMAACHSIAGEIKEGSMRYLAIRPISRTKLFFGKWLSILFMSAILIVFSTVIALLVGGAVYGYQSNTILSIFNGSVAFTIHPVIMVLIYVVSMLLEVIVYSMIAMLLSTLFKSDLISMTWLIVLYLINVLVPAFVQGANTWLAFYPFSHISLYSLFGSSVYATPNNFFNLLFGSKIYAGSHIALTLSVISLITIVIAFLATKIFKRKEL